MSWLALVVFAAATEPVALERDGTSDVLESGTGWVVRGPDGGAVPADELARVLSDDEASARIQQELAVVRKRSRRQMWVGVGITGAGAGIAALGLPIGEREPAVVVLVAGGAVLAMGPAWALSGVLSRRPSEQLVLAPGRYWTAAQMDALILEHNAGL
ncbi:MAG: hypothetical protein GY884_25770 [Proteobacteria bacterium]|nr:hypothetical protein [Pseudomonadota bacterium]